MATPLHERSFEADKKFKLPRAFIMRRLHSMLGLWLVLYLFQHLLVNAQAAFFFQDDAYGFIRAVNTLESLPFLKVIEVVFLGLPFLIHGLWGMYYAWTAKGNAHRTDGSAPALPQYKRNRAYSWERITAWILVVAILAHVVHMRFWSYPVHTQQGDAQNYMVRVSQDHALPLVAEKLNIQLYDAKEIAAKGEALKKEEAELAQLESGEKDEAYYKVKDRVLNEQAWLKNAQKKPLKKGELLAVSPQAGGAFFLVVRETFKNPLLVILYSLFVIAAAYHAFNGLWTFMITWGVTLSRRSQKTMRRITNFLMGIVMFLGLLSAWGTYWTFLFQT